MKKAYITFFLLIIVGFFFAKDPASLSVEQKQTLIPFISKYYRDDYSASSKSEENSMIENILKTVELTPIQIDDDADHEFAAWIGYHAGNHHNSMIFIIDHTGSQKRWVCVGALLGSQASVHNTSHEGHADLSTWWSLGSDQGEIRTYQMVKGFYEQVHEQRGTFSVSTK